METTVTIKFGSFEISCSGSESFIEKSFPVTLQTAKEIFLELGLSAATPSAPTPAVSVLSSTPTTGSLAPLTVSTISAKLKVASGPELILAACFSLHRQGRQTCTRKEITAEMKSASSYYKSTYVSNLSASLKTLITGNKLLEQGKGIFAIDAKTADALESQLGLS